MTQAHVPALGHQLRGWIARIIAEASWSRTRAPRRPRQHEYYPPSLVGLLGDAAMEREMYRL
ncbi:hypothetical protein [Mycolicibacterium llatzerense]|uniref:hypothetical protein n=1 Tax=Mycolicibacterium llatzerense TaxID=280871 RepID=UPI0021B6DFA9|nr:hypothetical protein [Mycolicibacterium llatzerense]